jgi:hypothetical protein
VPGEKAHERDNPPLTLAHVPAKWIPVRRKEHAPTQKRRGDKNKRPQARVHPASPRGRSARRTAPHVFDIACLCDRLMSDSGVAGIAKTLTTTTEEVRLHPASPARIVVVQATEPWRLNTAV